MTMGIKSTASYLQYLPMCFKFHQVTIVMLCCEIMDMSRGLKIPVMSQYMMSVFVVG